MNYKNKFIVKFNDFVYAYYIINIAILKKVKKTKLFAHIPKKFKKSQMKRQIQ